MKTEMDLKFEKAIELQNKNQFAQAEKLLNELLEELPQNLSVLKRLFIISYKESNFDNAIKYINKIMEIKPEPSYYKILGELYADKKDYAKAIEFYTLAFDNCPQDAELSFSLGTMFLFSNKPNQAIEYLKKGLEIEPNNYKAHLNMAIACDDLIDLANGKIHAQKAIELKPDYAEAKLILSTILLKEGDFKNGWKFREARFDVKNSFYLKIKTPKPEWEGDDLTGKIIFINSEEGFGDCILTSRFIYSLKDKGATVLLRVYPELEQLFRDSNIPAVLINENININKLDFDTHSSLMSLPYLLNINDKNMPFRDKYLDANPQKIKIYKDLYFNNDKFKIGIVWQCKNVYRRDEYRSIANINQLLPITQIPDIQLYSIQKGNGANQVNNLPQDVNIINLSETFNDFSDTAAAIKNMDLVISVDTSVLHLSAALGVNTYVMLEHCADWKWLLNKNKSYWYKNMTLFRQDKPQNWDYVINEITQKIKTDLL